jgi:glycosyltransferase involved in cell wall biosynthesis
MTPPRISIVIPVYKSEPFITLTLESARAQTFRDWEMVVVDDGSPDDSAAVVEEFCRRDPRIRLVRQANQGVAHARNRGLAETNPRSGFVIFLDGDDCWQPDALAMLLATLEAHPSSPAAHAIARVINAAGQPPADGGLERVLRERRAIINRRLEDLPPSAPTTFSALLLSCWIVTPGTCLIRRRSLAGLGGFIQQFTPSEDWEFWLRLARLRGGFAFVERVLLDYRRHGGAASADPQRMRAARARIFAHLRADASLTPEEQWQVRNLHGCTQRFHAARAARAACGNIFNGRWPGALQELGHALDHSFRALRGPRKGRE